MRTTPEVAALLTLAAAGTLALSSLTAGATRFSPTSGHRDLARLSLTGVGLGQAAVVVAAALVVGGEYGTGMIRTTLAAMPRRATVLAAKATVVGALALVAGTVAAAGSFLAGRLLLPSNGFTVAHGYPPLSLADGPTLRAVAGSALYLVLVALLALGVTVAVRDAAAAVGIVLGLLYLFPVVAHVVGDPGWERRLRQVAPMDAGLAVQATADLDALPIGPWSGLGVLAAWSAAALTAGVLALHLRDV